MHAYIQAGKCALLTDDESIIERMPDGARMLSLDRSHLDFVRIHICIYIYTCTYVYIYIHAYIHTYIHARRSAHALFE